MTCKCENLLHCNKSIAVLLNIPFRIARKTTSCERKNFFAIYGSFCEIDAFPLGVFSIRNFRLRNLKGNGNEPCGTMVYINSTV